MIRLKNISKHRDVLKIADQVMELFSQTFNVQGQEFLISCSAGIASYGVDGEDADLLIENANLAMHYAKKKGKSQYILCTPCMKKEKRLHMSLLNDLYGALDRNELILYYQPQVNIKTGKINGSEALIRWLHPERGIIYPGIFIPLAEKNGLINSIGKWVFQAACIQNKKWQDMNLQVLPIGVNVSAGQLIDVNIIDFIGGVLAETGLDPKYIELEITESMTIDNVGYIEKILRRLKEMGLVIAIDDFGTDHSSFNRLKTLPIDRIKIDMEFIQGIEDNKKDRTITKIMINLAKSLGVNVIAEGVETKEQLDFLKDKECDDVQGYYYYKSMPADEFEKLLIISQN